MDTSELKALCNEEYKQTVRDFFKTTKKLDQSIEFLEHLKKNKFTICWNENQFEALEKAKEVLNWYKIIMEEKH